MRNIVINEAESIFEVLWNHDGGLGTYKYCCLDEWTVDNNEYGKRVGNDFRSVQLRSTPTKQISPSPLRWSGTAIWTSVSIIL